MKRAVISSSIGNAFEWYDFALYAYFATVIGPKFFPYDITLSPEQNDLYTLRLTFAVFALGYFMRSLGALVFGHIGDKIGRKSALVLTIFLMTIPTTLFGLLPTYDQIGWSATLLMILIRILQGMSIGGNFGGSLTFMIEFADTGRRGLIGSIAVASCIGGILLGSFVAMLMEYILTPDQLNEWGWRIPFFLGLLVGLVGLYIRMGVSESPRFLAEQAARQARLESHGKVISRTPAPLKTLFFKGYKTLIIATFILLLNDVGFYSLFTYLVNYMKISLKISGADALSINTLSLVVMLLWIPVFGWLSDKLGRKKVMMSSALCFILFSYPLFMIFNLATFGSCLLSIIILGIILAAYFGPLPALMVEFFPTRTRYSGISIALNASAVLFGGTAPLILSTLQDYTTSQFIVAFYLIGGACISLVFLAISKERYNLPLR
jgi:MHS family proline/betaine transporter-like MFS transporter